jgi:hypothetical protein
MHALRQALEAELRQRAYSPFIFKQEAVGSTGKELVTRFS